MTRNLTISALIPAFALAAAPLTAQEMTYEYGLGVAAVPDYEGSETLQAVPYVSGKISRGQQYLAVEGTALRLNVVRSDRFESGPVLSFGGGRDDGVDNAAVARLPEIDTNVELGGFLAWNAPAGNGAVQLSAEVTGDVSDVYGGWQSAFAAGYGGALNERWSFGTSVTAHIVSDDYATTYFSVTPAGAAASGLAAFDAGGGLKDIGLDLGLTYALNERSALTGFVAYQRLLGDFADSPVVETADQFVVGIGFARSF